MRNPRLKKYQNRAWDEVERFEDYLITIKKKKHVQNYVYDDPFTFYHESPSLDEMTYPVATVKDCCPMTFSDP